MANAEPKDQPEGRFAEAMRKSKEKRAGMQRAPEKPATLEDESRNREDANPKNPALETINDSDT